MRYMQCPTCTRAVVINNTGICLDCQTGFSKKEHKDIWKKNENHILPNIGIENETSEKSVDSKVY